MRGHDEHGDRDFRKAPRAAREAGSGASVLERERGIGGAPRERLAGGGRRSARRTGVPRCARGARAPAATNPDARPARSQDRSGAGPVDRHGRAGRERARAGAAVRPRAGTRRLDAGGDRRPSRRAAPRCARWASTATRLDGGRVRRRDLRALRAAPPAHQDLRRRAHRQRRGAPGRVRLPAATSSAAPTPSGRAGGPSSWRAPEQSSPAPARSRSARTAPGPAFEEFAAHAARVVRIHGFTSRERARRASRPATADLALRSLQDTPGAPDRADRALADGALGWARALLAARRDLSPFERDAVAAVNGGSIRRAATAGSCAR